MSVKEATQLTPNGDWHGALSQLHQPYKSNLEHLAAGLEIIELRIRQAIHRSRQQVPQAASGDGYRGLYLTDQMIDEVLTRQLGQPWWNKIPLEESAQFDWNQTLGTAIETWIGRTRATPRTEVDLRLFRLANTFDLTKIEVEALLLIVAADVDPRFERLFGFLNDDVTRRRPTINLILSLLTADFPEQMRWRRLFGPESRLVKWQLIHVGKNETQRESTFGSQMVWPDQALINFLIGHPLPLDYLSDGLYLDPLENYQPAPWFSDHIWEQVKAASKHQPIFNFVGEYGSGQREAAMRLAHDNDQPLLELDMAALAKSKLSLLAGMTLAIRDSLLLQATLYLTGWHGVLKDHQPPRALLALMLGSNASIVITGEKLWQFRQQRAGDRPILTYQFAKLTYRERLQVWEHFIGDEEADLQLIELANHFQFTPGQIQDAVYTARNIARWENEPLSKRHLLEASRSHSNQNLAELAKKVTITVGWEDLILPEDPLTQLKELTNQARNRPIVHDAWGFGRKLPGRGISALFTGEPGTGKTMSAGIIASDLGLDLYKVDLSSLVSKYIGETEKNLDRVFTEANTSNAVLFFDEADSIFGKRSEVKDSHDRYANLEISYLLQRVESYDGISILATNMRSNLDEAFTRRFDFITDFPFPDLGYREKIWQIHFPSDTPISDDIDIPLLATRFRLAGGNIRKIVLSAAFLAAQDDQPISMQHMLHAVKREYQKMGRLIEDELFN